MKQFIVCLDAESKRLSSDKPRPYFSIYYQDKSRTIRRARFGASRLGDDGSVLNLECVNNGELIRVEGEVAQKLKPRKARNAQRGQHGNQEKEAGG